MFNFITHDYLKDNNISSKAVIPGSSSNVVDIYYDCLPDRSETFTLTFINGGPEVFVNDIISFSGGAVGRVTALTHSSGTWAGGDEQGTITVSQLTKHVVPGAETATSDSGGVIDIFATFTKDSFRDTSSTDCSAANLSISSYAIDDYIQPAAAAFSPANAIPWNETSGAAATDHFDTVILLVANTTATTWFFTYGLTTSVVGYVKLNAAGDTVGIMDTSGVEITVNLTSPLPHDGVSHSMAVILRRGAVNTVTCELDGVEIGSGSLNPAEDIQLTGENSMAFSNIRMQGFIAYRYKNGLPENYKDAIAEMKTNWSAGVKGISPELLGIR